MRLNQLNPEFLKLVDGKTRTIVPTLAEATGIMFLCPTCFQKNNGEVGTHSMICWFNGRGVPNTESPGPGRWNSQGTGVEDLTFVGPGATSVLIEGHTHFLIEHGEVKIC